MEFSKKDRVILINQYNILKRPDADSANHYDELIQILSGGYEVFYSMVDEWISDDMPREEGRFVLDLLHIYRLVEGYKEKNPMDTEFAKHRWAQFRGFDGNDETQYMTFTRFLINKQGKFTEQRKYEQTTDGFNSHMPTLDNYRRMVAKWHEKGVDDIRSKESLLEILDA